MKKLGFMQVQRNYKSLRSVEVGLLRVIKEASDTGEITLACWFTKSGLDTRLLSCKVIDRKPCLDRVELVSQESPS